MEEVNELLNGYFSAILFSETDLDTEEPLDQNYSISDFDKETVESSKKMLSTFYTKNKKAIEDSGLDLDTIGNDVWYTRAGHGAGFFDHNLDSDVEEKLTNGAKALGEYPTVESYDGKISVSGGRVFKYKNGGGVGKDKVFEVAYYGKKHLKQRGSSKGNYKTWVVAINREEAIEKVKNDDDEFAELKSAKPTNLDVERYKMKNGGGVEWDKDSDSIRTELGEFRVRITPQMQKGYYDVYVSANKKEIGKKYDVYGIANAKDIALEMISNSNKYAKGSTVNKYKDGGGIDMYSKFDFNKSGNFFATINNKNYEIIYRDDKSQMYDLFENDKKIKSSKNTRDLMQFPKKYDKGSTVKGGFSKGEMVFIPLTNQKGEVVNVGSNWATILMAHSKERKVFGFDEIEKLKNGGGIDINELNMPVIRTQFEDEEYEFKDGGTTKGFCYTIGGL